MQHIEETALSTGLNAPSVWSVFDQLTTTTSDDTTSPTTWFNPDVFDLSSDMESFMELDSIEEVKQAEQEEVKTISSSLLPDLLGEFGIGGPSDDIEGMDATQSLIDEVETYLQSVSGGVPTTPAATAVMEEQVCYIPPEEKPVAAGIDADRIFEALTTGKVLKQEDGDLNLDAAFTTTTVSADGENVIIIIAPPSPTAAAVDSPASTAVASPPPSPAFTLPPCSPTASLMSPASSAADTDAEWSPDSISSSGGNTRRTAAAKPRKKYERKVRATPPVGPYPKEKGERKKAQNRSAAFKYREKKKAEAEAVDEELERLTERNTVLKKKMSDMEIQLRCLKQLMIESGIHIPDGRSSWA